MKKINVIVVAAVLLATAGMQAQEKEAAFGPKAGVGVELKFNPFGSGAVFGTQGIKVRGFLNENIAIRGTLDFSVNSEKEGTHSLEPEKDDLVYTKKESTTIFGLTPGFEYHFSHFKRGSVYAGAEIGFNVGSEVTSVVFVDKADGPDSKTKGNIFGFNASLFTGVDVYLTQNLYLGAELGLGYGLNKTTPNKQQTNGSQTIANSSFTSTSTFGFKCEPSFRLGWTF